MQEEELLLEVQQKVSGCFRVTEYQRSEDLHV
jgi:hypothetical protein